MAIQYEWTDFIITPDEAERIQSREERLDVRRAVNVHADGWDTRLHCVLVTLDQIERPDDRFEAMEIDDRGNMTIWTQRRVWYLRFECRVKERLRAVPRHPEAGGAQLRPRNVEDIHRANVSGPAMPESAMDRAVRTD
jgi:hypothetical protein